MYKITKSMTTETGHRLINYPGECSKLHGHRYKWEITVGSTELNILGFVMDYKDLKLCLSKSVKLLDHTFVCHKDDVLISQISKTEDIMVLDVNPTSENLIDFVFDKLKPLLPDGVCVCKIKVHETEASFAEKQYT